jgi:hypothetical protein
MLYGGCADMSYVLLSVFRVIYCALTPLRMQVLLDILSTSVSEFNLSKGSAASLYLTQTTGDVAAAH